MDTDNGRNKNIPADSFRYIDSLDVKAYADTLFVKVYSQNYAYQSRNIYKIVKNRDNPTDTLMIYDFKVDLKMKDAVADAETFRVKNFTVNFVIKQNIDNMDKRIVFDKKFR